MASATPFADLCTLQYRYCHHLDAGDARAFADLFVPNGAFIAGERRHTGHNDLQRFIEERNNSTLNASSHFAANPLLERECDTATGHWQYLVAKTYEDGGHELGFGTHDVEYELTGDGWKITHIRATRRQTIPLPSFDSE